MIDNSTFPKMSDYKPQFEYEAWLLPYKSIDPNDILKNVYPHFEEAGAGKKQNDLRDSKNRRILSMEALFEDKSGQWQDDILGDNDISSSSSDPGPRNIPVTSSIQVFPNSPGPSIDTGPIPFRSPILNPGPSSSKTPSTTLTSPQIFTIITPKTKNKEKKQKSQRQIQLNPLQRKFKKALATPVIMSKAESMMLKMGWQGGALGKTGGGITEPIVPNLAYATSTKGFGQAPPSPKYKRKVQPAPPKFVKQTKLKSDKTEKQRTRIERRQQTLHRSMIFKENVMRYIFDFVINEREIAILFDKSLHNGQRKAIHNVVENIRKLGGSDVQSELVNTKLDKSLLLNIVRNNRYVLQSQSEGKPPYRYLCLFKEAPESMYLVTHFKLNDKENDFVIKEQIYQYHTFNKKKRKTDKWLVRNLRKKIDANSSTDKECTVVKESMDTCTVQKMVDDDREKDHDTENESQSENKKDFKSENETAKADEFNEIKEYDDEIKEIDKDAKDNKNNERIKKITDIEEEIRTASGACRITKKYVELDINKTELDINISPSQYRNIQTNESVENNENTIKTEDKLKSIDMEDEQNINETKTDSNDKTAINISILSSSRKEFMRYNLNMCFSDFISGNAFKEFKFLGVFDIEEFEVLNEFLKDFFLAKNGEPALDEEFKGIWNEAKCQLSFKQDLNGGIVIYKV